MAVQDDRREQEMCKLIGLRAGEGRSEVDAFLDFQESNVDYCVPIELKSTTGYSVSTARDVGPGHIVKWRSRIWVFGFYDPSGTDLRRLLSLGPAEMEEWIGKIEDYIAPDFAIGQRVARRLTIEDLHIICGEKSTYKLNDAMALHKRQWNRDKYLSEMDIEDGYTPAKMLEILRLRAVYLNERGSTLNNPHIPSSFLSQFDSESIDVTSTDTDEILILTQSKIRRMATTHRVLQQKR